MGAIMISALPGERRFGDDFVANWRQRYGRLPAIKRSRTYDIAVEEEFAPWRDWFDVQLAQLPAADADKLAGRLWQEKWFWPVINELATGAALRAAGLRIGYELRWGKDDVTPDWTVLDETGQPQCFVEVCTDQAPDNTSADMRSWHELGQRIGRIPVPVVLTVDGRGVQPARPTSGQAKRIADQLRRRLLEHWLGTSFEILGYRFIVMADRRTGRQMRSPHGMRAAFIPPSSTPKVVSAAGAAERVEEKVRKYWRLADVYDVPLVVAAGSDNDSNVKLSNFDDLLEGYEGVTFQFGPGDSVIGQHTSVMGQPQRWTMPSELSGVLWIANEFPFEVAMRPNTDARRSLPAFLASL